MLPLVVLAVLLLFCSVGMIYFLELRDIRRYHPKVGGNGFEVTVDVPCNRFHVLEVGFEISPPVPVEKIEHAARAVTGNVRLSFSQGETSEVDLGSTTSIVDGHKGVWIKTFMRQPAQWRWWCRQDRLEINARNLNFSLEEHKVVVYVSRDRRD